MKKFLKIFFRIILIIVLLTPITYIVYRNIFIIPHDSIGFLRDYTKGIEDKKLQPGLHWRFSGFIPNKWQLIILTAQTDFLYIKFNKKFRFAEFFPELENLFHINIKIEIEYSYVQEKIPDLLKKFNYEPKNIQLWLQNTIVQIIESNLLKFQNYNSINTVQKKLENFIELKNENNLFDTVQKTLKKRKVAISIVDIFIDSIQFPDEQTYKLQTEKIDSIFSAKITAEINRTLEESKIRAKQKEYQLTIEESKEISKLIDKQPLILEYFKYKLMNPNAKIILIDTKQPESSQFKEHFKFIENKKDNSVTNTKTKIQENPNTNISNKNLQINN